MSITWKDPNIEQVFRELQHNITLQQADIEFEGYHEMDFRELLLHRASIDFPNNSGWVEQENGDYTRTVYDNGRTGARVVIGELRTPINSEQEKTLVELFGFVLPRVFTRYDIAKRNSSEDLQRLEAGTYTLLSQTPQANIAEAKLTNNTLIIEHLNEPSLFELSEQEQRVNTIYGMYNQENPQPRREQLLRQYQILCQESAVIAATLTNHLSDNLQHIAMQEKYASLAKQHSMSIEEASTAFHNEFQSRKLMAAYGLPEEFLEQFAPMQRLLTMDQKYKWISDRSPKNKRGKNFDFNKIEHAPLTREATLVIDTHPDFLTQNERLNLLHHYIACWNEASGESISMDKELLISYHSEAIYRGLLNAKHTLRDARTWKETQAACPNYFQYARFVEQADNYITQVVEPNIEQLISMKVLKQEEADTAMESIIAEYVADREEVGSYLQRTFSGEQQIAIDLMLYRLRRPGTWSHIADPNPEPTTPTYTRPSHS